MVSPGRRGMVTEDVVTPGVERPDVVPARLRPMLASLYLRNACTGRGHGAQVKLSFAHPKGPELGRRCAGPAPRRPGTHSRQLPHGAQQRGAKVFTDVAFACLMRPSKLGWPSSRS